MAEPFLTFSLKFTLPDGTFLYGLLLEHIEGRDLDTEVEKELSPERQINIVCLSDYHYQDQLTSSQIQSCRHGARVLDVADVSQRDWHAGQILLHTNPTTKLDHAVFIDFASTTQTWETEELNFLNNYFQVLRILMRKKTGFDPELVWKYFGEPDDWDPLFAVMCERPGMEASKLVVARDMFPYISSA